MRINLKVHTSIQEPPILTYMIVKDGLDPSVVVAELATRVRMQEYMEIPMMDKEGVNMDGAGFIFAAHTIQLIVWNVSNEGATPQ